MPPLPATAAQALLTSLGNQAKFFFGTDNRPPFDTAGFIATDDPAPIAFRPAKQLARAACKAWARQPGPSTNPSADRLYAGACGEYLDSIGEGVDPGSIGPDFEGGQCAGILYTVTFQYNLIATDGSTIEPAVTATSNAIGPISGIRGFGAPDFQNIVIDSGVGPDFARTGSCPQGCYRNISIVSIARADSAPDTCGDPPPQYERPRPPITLPPITPIFIDLPDIGEIEVNVNVDAEGLITVESPTLNVEVNLGGPDDGTGDGGDGGDGGVGGDDLVPDGGLAGGSADTGDGGTAAGEAPPGQELVGVRVEVLESPIGTNTYDRIATTVYRGIGYVRMGYPGRLALDMGGAAVISPQFFLAPVRGLTSWEVRANNGFINRVTPFYRELPS